MNKNQEDGVIIMNGTIEIIQKRRTCRAYKPEQIKQEELDLILECGLCAPSGMNAQNWHFTVMQNTDVINSVSQGVRALIPDTVVERYTARNNGNSNFSMFYWAPTVILVSGETADGFASINCSLAAQNICIAAESLGVSSAIIGLTALLFNSPKAAEFEKELNIPKGYSTYFAICLGYKNGESVSPEKKADTVHYIR